MKIKRIKRVFCKSIWGLFILHTLITCRVFCEEKEEKNIVLAADIFETDKITLIDAVTFEPSPNPIKTIQDKTIIKEIIDILKTAVSQKPCDCLPEYTLKFYKNGLLLAELSYSTDSDFLRYGPNDFALPEQLHELLTK